MNYQHSHRLLIIYFVLLIILLPKTTSKRSKSTNLIENQIIIDISRNVTKKDIFCNYRHIYPYTSSKKDVVFFYSTIPRIGIVLSIVSLRYAAKDCRIIFFITKGSALLNSNWTKFFIENNIEMEILKWNDTLMHTRPNCYRFIAEQKWLHEHGTEVKRIFHSDSGDVFFPENPFVALPLDMLYYIGETKMVNTDSFNRDWMRRCGGDEIFKRLENTEIINSGSIGGSASEYIKFVDYMLETSLWKKCILIGASYDQPVLTILLNGGNLSNVVKYRIVGVQDGFITMALNPPKITGSGFSNWYNHKVIYMHQYDRFKDAANFLFDICHIRSYGILEKE